MRGGIAGPLASVAGGGRYHRPGDRGHLYEDDGRPRKPDQPGQHRVLTTIRRQLNDLADTVAELIDDDEQDSAEWNGVLDSLYTLMQAAKKEMGQDDL